MDVFAHLPPVNNHFVERANACTPQLSKTRQVPLGLVTVERDETAPLGWCAVPAGKVEDMRVLNDSDSVIFDFGGHRTGYLSFRLQPYKHGLEPNDSPCRLRLVFGEIISDIAEEFYPYTAWLSKAWLPDEIIKWVHRRPRTADVTTASTTSHSKSICPAGMRSATSRSRWWRCRAALGSSEFPTGFATLTVESRM